MNRPGHALADGWIACSAKLGLSCMRHACFSEDVAAGNTKVNITNFTHGMFVRQMAWVQEPWNAAELPAVPVGDPVQISLALQAKYKAVVGGARPAYI